MRRWKGLCSSFTIGLPKRWKTIVVAMDLGQPAAYAMRWSFGNIFSKGDSIRLLTVKGSDSTTSVEPMVSIRDPVRSIPHILGWSLESEEHSRAIQGWVKTYHITNISEDCLKRTEPGTSGIGAALCEYIERLVEIEGEESVMLVLGTRELGFMRRAFLGSVSDYCIRNCPAPVIVIKLPSYLAMQLKSRSIDDPDIKW